MLYSFVTKNKYFTHSSSHWKPTYIKVFSNDGTLVVCTNLFKYMQEESVSDYSGIEIYLLILNKTSTLMVDGIENEYHNQPRYFVKLENIQ